MNTTPSNENVISVTPLLKDTIFSLGAKRTSLNNESDELHTVALGSSHGEASFNPKYFPGSFNLCTRSQDLKYSALLHKRIAIAYPRVKNIVLFYSMFSSSWQMEMHPIEKQICPALNELFELGLWFEDELLEKLAGEICGKLDNFTVRLEGCLGGFIPISQPRRDSDYVRERVKKHQQYNNVNSANKYLSQLLLQAVFHGHNIIIVIPPVRSDFKNLIAHPSSHLFKDLREIVESPLLRNNIKLIDFWGSELFKDSDFDDCDHLECSGDGVKIVTTKIKEFLD